MTHATSVRITFILLVEFIGSFFLLDAVHTVYAQVAVIGAAFVTGLVLFFASLYSEKKRPGR